MLFRCVRTQAEEESMQKTNPFRLKGHTSRDKIYRTGMKAVIADNL